MIDPVRDFAAEAQAEAAEKQTKRPTVFDLVRYLSHHSLFSFQTFGPGPRTAGILKHIRKELDEIEREPADVFEWCDVAILAFDGALRAGWSPEQVADALEKKLAKNIARRWPDWRQVSPDQPIEHDRTTEGPR